MSYTFDGKISNQSPRKNGKGVFTSDVKCAKCQKDIEKPSFSHVQLVAGVFHQVYHYLDKPFFIFECKSGFSVVYCSEYCKKKHNHRYNPQ
jgi:hypothetical protein